MQRAETKARVRALQLLYAWDLTGRPALKTVIARVNAMYGDAPTKPDRSAELAAKGIAGLADFDQLVSAAAENWRLERVGLIERNILRLALAEIAEGETPSRVVIDEAVKLAYWFAGAKAPGFVNGVLDTAARQLGAL